MSPAGPDAFNHALHTANIWLADIATAFGTRDRRYCQRTLRAWLHTLRDRLTVEASAKFGAQLPELLRGVWYDGWEPSRVPVKYGVSQYVERFAQQSGTPPEEVPAVAGLITEVLAERMSPGQLAETFAELPADLRAVISGSGAPQGVAPWGGAPAAAGRPGAARAARHTDADRMARLEDQVSDLTEAVRTLAHGLEDGRLTGGDHDRASRAARLADEILLASGGRESR